MLRTDYEKEMHYIPSEYRNIDYSWFRPLGTKVPGTIDTDTFTPSPTRLPSLAVRL